MNTFSEMKTVECPHCWHTDVVMLNDPPQTRWKCCWCAMLLTRAEGIANHGKHRVS